MAAENRGGDWRRDIQMTGAILHCGISTAGLPLITTTHSNAETAAVPMHTHRSNHVMQPPFWLQRHRIPGIGSAWLACRSRKPDNGSALGDEARRLSAGC